MTPLSPLASWLLVLATLIGSVALAALVVKDWFR